jgi:DinB superfamily
VSDALHGVVVDSFTRIRDYLGEALAGLTPDQLAWQPRHEANSIGWLAWHLTRIQDDHIAAAAGATQVWTGAHWFERMALPYPAIAIGYGHTPGDVGAGRVESVDLLTGYHQAVYEATVGFVHGLTEADFDRIVDERWDPPVTLAVRLVSVITDDLEHVGQAAYVRGLLERA